ncbi:MAG: aminopeptidase N [Bacteriovoracaceae bacterium]|jgi:aminopeptidase N
MSSTAKTIFLKDYKTPNFWADKVDLDFDIFDDYVIVISETKYLLNSDHGNNTLELDGVDLELLEVSINNKVLSASEYELSETKLSLNNLPSEFTLKITVKIFPEKNFANEGLYKSGNIYCTQCEAEGFRRITYFLDRPDVMSSFSTTLRADKKKYPLLLSNGNNIESTDLEGGRHLVKWIDPFKKPAYLFAAVAGDLALVKDTFKTCSGRDIDLEIYVDHGNEDKCGHAMISLQNSMKWDEEKFGLEYDLDIYMVVAVDSFNMGAMENKGLNIFNSSYVLAKKETATDSDFEGIEAVIGHEYFHNWTGNRVTCRDWFQLTLKEGLTVFRDQEFSSDMLSRPVKRIEDVTRLRSNQFPEDGGPMSHPIQPKSFVEINNFYTATIYEKGAEIIRMIHTLIGADSFRKGMDLYFQRHDGQAVTTQDFVAAMSDASGVNLEQFKVWYDQSGTPDIKITTEFNIEEKQFIISLEQVSQNNNNNYSALHMPFHISLYTKKGERLEIENDGKYELTEKTTILTFNNINEDVIPSFNENFTAPVNVHYNYTKDSLSTLMAFCQDGFNQYDAAQSLVELEINDLSEQSEQGKELEVSKEFLAAYKALLTNNNLEHAFRACALSLPSINDINAKKSIFDFEHLPKAISFLRKTLGNELYEELLGTVNSLQQKGEFSVSAKAIGERSLKNFALDLLFQSTRREAVDLIFSHYQSSNNMTDEFSALSILTKSDNQYRDRAIETFYNNWKSETLVMQKWLGAQARADDTNIETIKKLEKVDIYNPKIPNLLRSLISVFGAYNPLNFHNEDGSGYKFYADKVIEVDAFNPQIAAGMCKRFNFMKKLDPSRKQNLKAELERIKGQKNLSNDTLEVVTKNLEA